MRSRRIRLHASALHRLHTRTDSGSAVLMRDAGLLMRHPALGSGRASLRLSCAVDPGGAFLAGGAL